MEDSTEVSPKTRATPRQPDKHRIWMRMQQSTPDGLLPRHVVDRDYELWLYPNLADVLRLRIRAVVNEVEALQKDHERAYKRSGRGR